MNQGHLHILGNSDYIKKKFGEGYHHTQILLTLLLNNRLMILFSIKYLMLNKMKKTSQNTLKYIFPFES